MKNPNVVNNKVTSPIIMQFTNNTLKFWNCGSTVKPTTNASMLTDIPSSKTVAFFIKALLSDLLPSSLRIINATIKSITGLTHLGIDIIYVWKKYPIPPPTKASRNWKNENEII